jgi:tetratricopeptide (TPR) repeat protein
MGAGPRDALLRARQAYNQQQYDAAIEAATEAQRVAASADAAALVLARARLERFRQKGSADDLAAARDGFIRLDSSRLTPRERQELLVGLGEVLFLDERYGAAAEQFNLALSRGDPAAPGAWRTLEWWASAVDRQAQLEPGVDQKLLYAPVLQRMEDELRGNAASAVASYWLSAAARGVGDLPRAWDAAVAGWVRAPLSGDQREALRADLDRLVLQAIIPERARQSASGRDPGPAVAALRADWDRIKQQWTAR